MPESLDEKSLDRHPEWAELEVGPADRRTFDAFRQARLQAKLEAQWLALLETNGGSR